MGSHSQARGMRRENHMAFSDIQAAMAGELARSDLTNEIKREINNAITFYGNKAF